MELKLIHLRYRIQLVQCNSIKFKIIPIKAKILLIKLCVCKYGLDTSQEGEGQQKEWSCLPHA